MMTFTDRQPAVGKENRYKLTKADGSFEYVKLERADEANPVGTPLNKTTFENMQTATIKDVCKTGHYTGNGQNGHIIDVGFKPRIVLILQSSSDNYSYVMGFAIENKMVVSEAVTLVENGFSLANNGNVNSNNTVYNYIAFR